MRMYLILTGKAVASMTLTNPPVSCEWTTHYSFHPKMTPDVQHAFTLEIDKAAVGHTSLEINAIVDPPRARMNNLPLIQRIQSRPCSCCHGHAEIQDKRGGDQPCPACEATGSRAVEELSVAKSLGGDIR